MTSDGSRTITANTIETHQGSRVFLRYTGERTVVNLLNPVYQFMNDNQPGTALLVGGATDSST